MSRSALPPEGWLDRAWGWLGSIGEREGESSDQHLTRQLVVFGGAMMSGGGALWSTIAWSYGLWLPGVIPAGYVGLTLLNLVILAWDRQLGRARATQIMLSLFLPFLFQGSLGGFFLSGGMMLWAMISLVGALTIARRREALTWLALYVVLTVGSGVLDGAFRAHAPWAPSEAAQRAFFVINVVTISVIVFGLAMTLTQRQRRAILALEAEQTVNVALNRQLEDAVTAREDDIVRLRDAQAELERASEGLEAQVQARTADLEAALLRAEAGTRAKGEFLAVMSHEIRTPLNGILGTADLLQLAPLAPDQQELVRLVRRSGDLLLTILNDVLDFSKVEAGKLELVARPFDLRAEVEAVVALHRPVTLERGVALRVEIAPELPRHVMGDAVRLMQILGNLLANAVKFTHQGQVTVSIGVRADEDEPPAKGARLELDVAVSDTGIGIEASALRNLFQPFYQADATTTRRYGGTGLGLAVCAQLVRLMGGAISAQSDVGVGSTFHFHVPVDRVSAEVAQGEAENAAPGFDADGMSVLVAEDNPVNQTIARRLLEQLGCEVSLADDGRAAVEIASGIAFDLILMDVRMPVLDGLSAARAIRSLPLPRQPRIVAVTANAYESDRAECLDAGMDDFMPKPLRLETLRRQLRRTRAVLGGRLEFTDEVDFPR
jgi:signal transduction histidine kinase/ActR/RegA family two-component response regulator